VVGTGELRGGAAVVGPDAGGVAIGGGELDVVGIGGAVVGSVDGGVGEGVKLDGAEGSPDAGGVAVGGGELDDGEGRKGVGGDDHAGVVTDGVKSRVVVNCSVIVTLFSTKTTSSTIVTLYEGVGVAIDSGIAIDSAYHVKARDTRYRFML